MIKALDQLSSFLTAISSALWIEPAQRRLLDMMPWVAFSKSTCVIDSFQVLPAPLFTLQKVAIFYLTVHFLDCLLSVFDILSYNFMHLQTLSLSSCFDFHSRTAYIMIRHANCPLIIGWDLKGQQQMSPGKDPLKWHYECNLVFFMLMCFLLKQDVWAWHTLKEFSL